MKSRQVCNTIAFFVCAIFAPHGALAASLEADIRGNGGHVLFCERQLGLPPDIFVLDEWEGQAINQLPGKYDLGEASLSVEEKIDIALSRIPNWDAPRREKLRKRAAEFMSEALFLDGVDLPLVPDADPDALPRGCSLRQIAVQRKPEFPGLKYYRVNNDLWNMMTSTTSRAALILHEIIYRESLERGASNSRQARYLNEVIGSNFIATYTRQSYNALMRAVGFPNSCYYGSPGRETCFEFGSERMEKLPTGKSVFKASLGEPFLLPVGREAPPPQPPCDELFCFPVKGDIVRLEFVGDVTLTDEPKFLIDWFLLEGTLAQDYGEFAAGSKVAVSRHGKYDEFELTAIP